MAVWQIQTRALRCMFQLFFLVVWLQSKFFPRTDEDFSYNLGPTSTSRSKLHNSSDIYDYLRETDLPSLMMEKWEDLSKPIADTVPGKAPRPDGFTLPYYKTYQDSLASFFLTALNAILDGHSFLVDMLRVSISAIPKLSKDPLLCASYRPICLLNCDVKLFTKILDSRMNVLLQCLVATDQAGFIQTRKAMDNTIWALNIIEKSKMIPYSPPVSVYRCWEGFRQCGLGFSPGDAQICGNTRPHPVLDLSQF